MIVTYGVMATQQILVLLFQVRVLVGQRESEFSHGYKFWIIYRFPSFPRGSWGLGRIGCYVVRQQGFFIDFLPN